MICPNTWKRIFIRILKHLYQSPLKSQIFKHILIRLFRLLFLHWLILHWIFRVRIIRILRKYFLNWIRFQIFFFNKFQIICICWKHLRVVFRSQNSVIGHMFAVSRPFAIHHVLGLQNWVLLDKDLNFCFWNDVVLGNFTFCN